MAKTDNNGGFGWPVVDSPTADNGGFGMPDLGDIAGGLGQMISGSISSDVTKGMEGLGAANDVLYAEEGADPTK